MPKRQRSNQAWAEKAEDWAKEQKGKCSCECGCGRAVVVRWFHYYKGIPRVIQGHGFGLRPKSKSRVWVEENQGKHFCRCGCGQPIPIKIHHHTRGVPTFLNRHAPHAKKLLCGRRRERNGRYRGGRFLDRHGYIKVLIGTQPDGRSIYQHEHRQVMERLLGRRLVSNESVHHRDGIRSNNAPNNLELWASRYHPPGQRVRDLIVASAALLNTYLADKRLWPKHLLPLRDTLATFNR